jgi:hypothetical protein
VSTRRKQESGNRKQGWARVQVTRAQVLLLALTFAFPLIVTATFADPSQTSELPEGPGRTILMAACTTCHELKEVTKFRGFYTKDEWRDIVTTMVKYGAVVKGDDVPVLVEYLFKNLGKKE